MAGDSQIGAESPATKSAGRAYHRAVRCFVALDLPDPVYRHLADVTVPLRDRYDVKWVHPEDMHMTLLFAGDLTDPDVDDLIDAVMDIDIPPLSLRLQRLGHFPPRAVPRVLWAGVGGDIEALDRLHGDLEAAATDLGIERDRRGFTPHVTLGRVTSDFGALAMVDALQRLGDDLKQKPFAPRALTVYSSELRPTGPIYRALLERPVPAAD